MRKSSLVVAMLAVALGSSTVAFARGGGGGGGMGSMGMSSQHSWQAQEQYRMQTQARHQYGRPTSTTNLMHYQLQSRDQYRTQFAPR